MLWPNLLWSITGVDCQWVAGPCEGLWRPFVVMNDGQLVPLLVLAVVGCFTCLRMSMRLLFFLLRRLFLTPEQRAVAEFKKRAQAASADYLRPYQ